MNGWRIQSTEQSGEPCGDRRTAAGRLLKWIRANPTQTMVLAIAALLVLLALGTAAAVLLAYLLAYSD
jgi:hypothetical protein